MICSHSQLEVNFYQSTEEIPEFIWNQLVISKSLYLQKHYLEAIESNHSDLQFLYVSCLNEKQELVGFANIQLFNFKVDSLENNWQNMTKKIVHFARKFRIIPKEKPLRILNCGLPFVSGNHGLFLHPDTDKKKVLKKIIKSVQKHLIGNTNYAPIDIYIIKDFTEDQVFTTNELISLGYYSFNVEPNMLMQVPKNWENLNDYLNSLKTKFRVKAKRALSLSKDLRVDNLTASTIKNEMDDLTHLYQRVTSNAGFNLIDFNLNSYVGLLDRFDKNYFVRTYRIQNKLVGFMSGMHNQNILDAHFVGIDYDLNRELGIYQRMLYDYIAIAIDKKVSRINFGRTASEIKSSVGASPEHLTVYIRHKKSITNKFLQLFLYRVQPSEFNQKFPFKQIAAT